MCIIKNRGTICNKKYLKRLRRPTYLQIWMCNVNYSNLYTSLKVRTVISHGWWRWNRGCYPDVGRSRLLLSRWRSAFEYMPHCKAVKRATQYTAVKTISNRPSQLPALETRYINMLFPWVCGYEGSTIYIPSAVNTPALTGRVWCWFNQLRTSAVCNDQATVVVKSFQLELYHKTVVWGTLA